MPHRHPPAVADRRLRWFLQVIGGVSLLAFAAAVMPQCWMVEITAALGLAAYPDSALTDYLARNLSLLYGFVGAALLVVAGDLDRYRPLVRYAWVGTLLFGVLQFVVDSMAGMPAWWVVGESGSTVIGGAILAWLDVRARAGLRVDAAGDSGPIRQGRHGDSEAR